MELPFRNLKKILNLIEKGVEITNPYTIDIGDEVDINRISGKGVKIYPGCRIYGAKTVISADSKIGYEGPVTIDDCQIGPKSELKGGFFNKAAFLEKSNMGLGAHVREGCILEEEAGGAHCVGLKQTILFPFVTLGSLINFCDCFMAGGTSRKEHSEVGSSYIHFNYTPDGNKCTASLIGDVPRGVMLNKPPIFLGGQGGLVGPVRIGYGNVIAAGSIVRKNCSEDNKLIIAETHKGLVRDFIPHSYKNIKRLLQNNFIYISNLIALEQWYIYIRKSFFDKQELGDLIYEGALEKLCLARKERISRLKTLAEKAGAGNGMRAELTDRIDKICEFFSNKNFDENIIEKRDKFLTEFEIYRKEKDYIKTIKSLPIEITLQGTDWLQSIIDDICAKTDAVLDLADF